MQTKLTLLAISTLITCPLVHSDDKSAVLHFINGDSLSGTMTSLDKDQLTFQGDAISEQMELNRNQLLHLDLPSPVSHTPPKLESKHIAIVTLEDRFYPKGERDTLKGQLTGINNDFIELETSYAGKLKVDRSLIYSLDITSQKALIYSGPNSLEEWTELGTPKTWSFSNSALIPGVNDSSVAIELDFPSRCHLGFTVDKKKHVDLSILLFAENAETENPSNYYELTINSNYMNMRKYIEKGSSKSLTRLSPSRRNTLSETLRYDIYSELDTGHFHIYINGELFAEFSDTTPKAEIMGNSLHFRSQRGYEMRIRDIELSKWSGTLPKQEEELATALEGDGSRILLANGDAIIGEIGETKDEQIQLKTKHADFAVPIANITSILLTEKQENHPRADRYDLKAYFKTGGWIILDPIKVDSKTLLGNHEAIGDVSFDMEAFSKIEFNIYDRKLKKLREDNW